MQHGCLRLTWLEIIPLMRLQKRVEQLTGFLAGHMGFAEHQAAAEAAARLALADLATATVTEMTVLAGVMGRIYALRQGEQPEVAQAIFESVLPRCFGLQSQECMTALLWMYDTSQQCTLHFVDTEREVFLTDADPC